MSDQTSLPLPGTVTAVVVSYRTGPVLFDSLEALLAAAEIAEIVLVDNGNDGPARAQLARLAAAQARLTIVEGQGNIGFAAGCNLGAARATTPYLAFVNPDCVCSPGAFAGLIAALEADPEAWMASPRLVGANGEPERGTPRAILTPWTALVETLGLWRIAPNHPSFQRLNLYATDAYWKAGPVPAISGAFMFVRTKRFQALGGFDERYFMHVEDLDLCLQIARAGGTIVYLPEITAVHRRASSRVARWRLEWRKTMGATRYMRKNFAGIYPGWALALVGATLWARLFFVLTLGRLFARER
jgi:N-acetylglucosaminyl-diphospho-decaprenol L-rhamnosyltransferase